MGTGHGVTEAPTLGERIILAVRDDSYHHVKCYNVLRRLYLPLALRRVEGATKGTGEAPEAPERRSGMIRGANSGCSAGATPRSFLYGPDLRAQSAPSFSAYIRRYEPAKNSTNDGNINNIEVS